MNRLLTETAEAGGIINLELLKNATSKWIVTDVISGDFIIFELEALMKDGAFKRFCFRYHYQIKSPFWQDSDLANIDDSAWRDLNLYRRSSSADCTSFNNFLATIG